MNNTDSSAQRPIYIAIFIVAMATLMGQILITRLFSVTMFYHFAFAIISLTMLGLTSGALNVFLYSDKYPYRSTLENIAFFMTLYGISNILAVIAHISFPFLSDSSIFALCINFLIFLPGFTFSGIVITLILTQYTQQVSKLYAADLCGAAVGCIVTLIILDKLGAINSIFFVGFLLALVAWFLSKQGSSQTLRQRTALLSVLLGGLLLANITLPALKLPHINIQYSKGTYNALPAYEIWNTYSRVTFAPVEFKKPVGWGLSDVNTGIYEKIKQSLITIDAGAGTVLTNFDGDLNKVAFLKDDVINSAYHLRPVSSVAVIGVGGGRDILSALLFNADRILGIEMNKGIIEAVTGVFGDFAGNLHKNPKVKMVNDEARSYLTRQSQTFDMIQVSLIDTWAATAAGAFGLTENTIYTMEAWQTFFNKLTPQGILTFSRWYKTGAHEGELYRMLSMSHTLLKSFGVKNITDHVIVVHGKDISTLILSKSPITKEEEANLNQKASQLGFRLLVGPFQVETEENRILTQILQNGEKQVIPGSFHLDISPSTDNRPFFFNMIGFKETMTLLGDSEAYDKYVKTPNGTNVNAMFLMMKVLIIVSVFAAMFIFYPLSKRASFGFALKTVAPDLTYFAMIGLGFMFIEIAQMQRIMVFLGHPTYALAVVLFSLLLSSGLGSLSTDKVTLNAHSKFRLVILSALLVLCGLATEPLLNTFRESDTAVRILVAIGLLFPAGFFMGMGFPLGMKLVEAKGQKSLSPWLWGTNGATSVVASVLALAIAIFFGIRISYWIGVSTYLIATLMFTIELTRLLKSHPTDTKELCRV